MGIEKGNVLKKGSFKYKVVDIVGGCNSNCNNCHRPKYKLENMVTGNIITEKKRYISRFTKVKLNNIKGLR